jgi:hypothetical protein
MGTLYRVEAGYRIIVLIVAEHCMDFRTRTQ